MIITQKNAKNHEKKQSKLNLKLKNGCKLDFHMENCKKNMIITQKNTKNHEKIPSRLNFTLNFHVNWIFTWKIVNKHDYNIEKCKKS